MAIRAAARSWRTWVFLAAFASAFWQCLIFPGAGFGAGYESAAIARSVARGHGFANPFAAGVTGPTAHLAPLFPVLLAALIRAFGDPLFSLAAATLCCTIHGIHALMLPAMARSVCGDAKAGLCAAFWVAMVPTIPVLPQWEAIYAAVAFMFFCLATGALMDSCAPEVSELRGVTDGMVAGAYSGLLMLLSPALVTAAGLWMIFRLAGRWPGRRRCVIFLAAFAAAMAAMDAPWVLRNRHELGACFFIRDNLGLELYSSNSDCAEPRASRDLPNDCHASMHPNENAREAAAVRNMGEVRYNSSRMREAVRWIERHPSRFWWLVLRRVGEFWFPTPGNPRIYAYSVWFVTGLSAIGLIDLIRRRERAAWFLAGALVVFSLPYYFVQSEMRYRTPVLWLSLVPAGIGARFVWMLAVRRLA
jgi:hypothetical protein